MKVRIEDPTFAQFLSEELSMAVPVGTVFQASENYENWTDDETGVLFFCLVEVEVTNHSLLGYWAHTAQVRQLTHSEELSSLGYPGFSDDFAEQVLLYMTENDCTAQVAIVVITGKDTYVTGEDHG